MKTTRIQPPGTGQELELFLKVKYVKVQMSNKQIMHIFTSSTPGGLAHLPDKISRWGSRTTLKKEAGKVVEPSPTYVC